METTYFLGIDISKNKIDTALTINGKDFHFDQVENRSAELSKFFENLKKQLSSFLNLVVCLEHTGIYCQPVLDVMVKFDIKVCVESALRIKQSQGMARGKADKVDAKRIAIYALKNYHELLFWKPQRESVQKLKALLVLRDRLVKAKTLLEVPLNESGEFIDSKIQRGIKSHCKKSIKSATDEIKALEKDIRDLIKHDQKLSQQMVLATSVPGIGLITAANVIVSTAEFTRISTAKKFACYTGVAPFEHTSGSSIRGRTRVSSMANMTIKKLLHLAAMTAIQYDEELRAFYLRKVESGKNKMSVLNAVRNKLITRIYSCIKNNRMYEKKYQYQLG